MSESNALTRRRFMTRLAQAGATPLLLGSRLFAQQVPRPPGQPTMETSASGPKAVLTLSDFTYLGSFRMPDTAGGQSTANAYPLTLRYVNGQLRFFGRTQQQGDQGVYEAAFPGLGSNPSSSPLASVVRYWGNIYGNKMVIDDPNPGGNTIVFGLYWDEPDKRLYWTYANNYTTYGTSPVVGYSTLNDSTGAATAVGAYYISGHTYKKCLGGLTAIPSDFASQYTGGRRLGIGFGGNTSAGQTASLGPALTAIAPPTGGNLSTIPSTPLIGYAGVAQAEGTRPRRCQRNTDYNASYSPPWNPSGSPLVGWWQWNDAMSQSGVWIDTGTHHGVLFGCRQGRGRLWYESSDQHAERGSDEWFIVDPADLAKVAQGSLGEDLVVPAEYSVQYPGESYPIGGWQGLASGAAPAFCFDASTKRLYVGRPNGWKSELYYDKMLVHCYQVA